MPDPTPGAPALPPVPTSTAGLALDAALTGEEIALFEISLNNSPQKIIEAIQRAVAARQAAIDAANRAEQANPSADNLEKAREMLG